MVSKAPLKDYISNINLLVAQKDACMVQLWFEKQRLTSH